MQIQLFSIAADDYEGMAELNRFLRTNRVLEVQQEFVSTQQGAYWCFCVRYLLSKPTANAVRSSAQRKEKTDYKKTLDEKTFGVFSKLRLYRKEIAKNDAVPAYAVFTDAELVQIAALKELSPQKIQSIKGIGAKRVEKYADQLIKMYNQQVENDSLEKTNG